MLNRLRNAVSSVKERNGSTDRAEHENKKKPEKFTYVRPFFLGLTWEEVTHSRDFGMRPIITPRSEYTIPWNSGYAECINGGKSNYNEDNSCAGHMRLVSKTCSSTPPASPHYRSPVYPDGLHCNNGMNKEMVEIGGGEMILPLYAAYFGVFDGHAGYSTSLIASKLLYRHVQDKLTRCLDCILDRMNGKTDILHNTTVTVEDLVVGALEDAFIEMDNQLDRERTNYFIKGGCTALVALFFNGKLYLANAGDCRAVLCHGDEVIQMSTDFTPESERARLNYIGWSNPDLLHNEFSCIEFIRRVSRCDLGKELLCRKPGMEGWSLKTVEEDDLKFPLVNGEGKRARVMGTIGVTRGLGDHDLYVFDSNIWIKPFLSPKPEVKIFDISEREWSDKDILILGSDGLWDTITNTEAVQLARNTLATLNKTDKNRYTIAAQDLVHEARGHFTGTGWRKNEDEKTIASFDDITAFVIPIKPYKDKWQDTGQAWDDSYSAV